MTPTRVAFRLEITDADAFARCCGAIEDGKTLEELYADTDSGVTQESMEEDLHMFRDSFASRLALFLAMGDTGKPRRNGDYSVRNGNIASTEFSCVEAAARAKTQVTKSCPPGITLVDISDESVEEKRT